MGGLRREGVRNAAPADRADARYSVRPSAERLGPPSKLGVLIIGPRFFGDPNSNGLLGARVSDEHKSDEHDPHRDNSCLHSRKFTYDGAQNRDDKPSNPGLIVSSFALRLSNLSAADAIQALGNHNAVPAT